ncbi:uncharacterized protein LOC118467550 [Anopheles albimanus]|uniref:uncharacterized protein LOC118467550 n=1 Tax=Anopheles albimanus TaxID=7167 RepID=UPI00164171E5|nr:uncharacterized protein LOC118467550 [Anopheles albimanus]
MAIPWGPNESEDEEQSSNNVDIEAGLREAQNNQNKTTDTNDKGQKSNNEEGIKSDGDSCISEGCIVADDSTSTVGSSSTTTCVDRSTLGDYLQEIFGSFSAGCLAIALDFVKVYSGGTI